MPELSSLATPDPVGRPDPGPVPVVTVLVISYNTRELTLEALRSLRDQTTVPYELIVLDNASSDGSAEAIAAEFPEARLIASRDNLGFAGGNNVAARQARGRYILLLNPDTVVLDHAVDRLVAFAERRPEAAIWGGRTLYGDMTLNPTNAFGELTLWSLFCRASGLAVVFRRSEFFNPEGYGAWDRSTEREVGFVSGCFFLITRALWQRLGGFDLTFVMYGEEADLCRRARDQGLARPRMTPDATIIHYVGASSKRRADKDLLVLKAKATTIRRHLPAWQRRPALALLALWPWSRMASGRLLARLAGRPQFAEAAAHWGAVWQRRADWLAGYPPAPADPAAAATG